MPGDCDPSKYTVKVQNAGVVVVVVVGDAVVVVVVVVLVLVVVLLLNGKVIQFKLSP